MRQQFNIKVDEKVYYIDLEFTGKLEISSPEINKLTIEAGQSEFRLYPNSNIFFPLIYKPLGINDPRSR